MNSFFTFLLKLIHDQRGNISLTGDPGTGGVPDGGGNAPADPGVPPADGTGGGAPVPPTEPSNSTKQPSTNFLDGLEDDLKNDPSLKVFLDNKGEFNVKNMVKSYIHAQRKMGTNAVTIPDKTSPQEDWGNFYNKLRDPNIDKYDVKNTLPDGQALDEEMFKGFKQEAHANGLTTTQAQKVLDWYNSKTLEAQKTFKEESDAKYEKEVTALKKDWGEGMDKELKLSQRAIREFADDATINALKEAGLDKNVHLIRLFNKIGKGLVEGSFKAESHGAFGVTVADAEKKIAAIMGDSKSPYWDPNHAQHKHVVDEVMKYRQATMT